MSILTVELPDETMESLQRAAQSRGQEVGALVREWAQSVSETHDVEDDPFWRAAGMVTGEAPPDLASNHDSYLAQESLERHETA